MPSKDVMDRIRLAHGLTSIIEQLSGPIAEGLAGQLAPQLRRGEGLPDLGLTPRLMGRLVMAGLRVLITADELYQRARDELAGEDP